VERERRAGAGERVHLRRVAEFLLQRRRGRGLHVLAEPGAGVGEAPRGQLDAERVQRGSDAVGSIGAHTGLSL